MLIYAECRSTGLFLDTTNLLKEIEMEEIEIGTSYVENVPITDGWTGFTNKIRKLFGRPVLTRRECGVRFDPGIIVLPGENRFIFHKSLQFIS